MSVDKNIVKNMKPWRPKSLCELENLLLLFPQVDWKTEHNFVPGIYARSLLIPKNCLLIGKRHRNVTLNIVAKGSISIYMGPDQPFKHVCAGAVFTSPPYTKKMGFAHEETVFITIHLNPSDETDVDKLEEELIIPEEEFTKLRETLLKTGGAECRSQLQEQLSAELLP